MATKHKAKSKKAKRPQHKARAARPTTIVVRNPVAHGPKKKSRNPIGKPRLSGRWVLNTAVQAAQSAVLAYGGMLATREIPQMWLGSENTGNKGLAANLGVGLAATALTAALSPRSAIAVATGAVLGIATRYISESVMPVVSVASSPVSGVGDVMTITAADASRRLIPVSHPGMQRFARPVTSMPRQRTLAA